MTDNPKTTGGYVCAPYLHDHDSIELKDSWVTSKNIESLYFVTATFSEDSKPYFLTSSNHYILAKFKDPVGKILETWRRPNNLTIKKVSNINIECQNKRFAGDSITAPNWSDELNISPDEAAIKI